MQSLQSRLLIFIMKKQALITFTSEEGNLGLEYIHPALPPAV